MKRRNFRRQRNQNGNMLVLGGVVMAVVGLGLMIGYSYGGLVFTHNRLQASADEIALAGARKLNENDRIGQMNNMIARSRQLVYESHQHLLKVQDNYPQLADIADQLYTESRDTAKELEIQRNHLKWISQQEAMLAMEKKFDQIKTSYPMSLPWMKIGKLHTLTMRYGRMDNVESNVEELKNIPELENWDNDNNYIKNNPGLKLYKYNCKAELPAPDEDLKFYLCSLAAPVEKTVSPAHIALSKAFQIIDSHEIASSTHVKVELNVATGLGGNANEDLSAESTAAATGASPQQ